MNEDEATRLFDALGEGVPDRRPPVPGLVAAGRTAVRRRTRRAMALAAASVAVVLGGGAVVQQVIADDERRGVVTNPGPEDGRSDPPSEGVRLVGGHRITVEVPDSWVADDGCGPTRGALLNVREPGAVDDDTCGVVRSLVIFDADSELGRELSRYPLDDRVIGGLEVRVGDACQPTVDCIFPIGQVVDVPAEDVVLLVSGRPSDDAEVVESVVSSIQLMRDGFSTVPYLQPGEDATRAFALLSRAKLMDQVRWVGLDGFVPEGPDPSGGFFHSIDPLSGTVVGDDETVTVTLARTKEDALMVVSGYAPNMSMTVTPSTARPGEVVALTFPTEIRRGLGFTLFAPVCDDCTSPPSMFSSATYYLSSDAIEGTDPQWSNEPQPIRSIGVRGPGPDHVVIPDVAEPGHYMLCTRGAEQEVCTTVTIPSYP